MSRLDVCESKVEVTTPFWASNSNGKVMIMMIMIIMIMMMMIMMIMMIVK